MHSETMNLDETGWLDRAERIASPNCDQRPVDVAIQIIVIHNISLPPGVFDGDAVIALFSNRLDWNAHPYYQEIQGLKVSSHFFIRRDGHLIQFVPCSLRAWHAGVSNWRGRERCNDFSIGIELEGSDEQPFTDAQYATLAPLVATLRHAYPIEDVAGHSDIAPGRKTDPGPCFDWTRLPAQPDTIFHRHTIPHALQRVADRSPLGLQPVEQKGNGAAIGHPSASPLRGESRSPLGPCHLLQSEISGVIMRIGTPLSPTATRVMLLGAGELGKEVIIALQRLGIEVIAVDRYENAPGHQVAHRTHVIDMSDARALRALVEQEKPHLIVPEIEAIATEELLAIEASGLAEVIPTARAANLTMNREGIRRLAAETLGLPTSPYVFAGNFDELAAAADKLGFPCIVKPVMSSSGKGQSKVDHPGQLRAAWDYAASGGRVDKGRVIVEGFIDFDYEITLLTVRAAGVSETVETFFCEPVGHVQVRGDYVESWQPQAMRPVALERARNIAQAVTGNLGGRGLFGVELFVRGDAVWFSEVSPRPHDTGMVTMCTQRQSEFELHARAILGFPVDVSLREPGASAVIYGGMEAAGIAFEGVAQALQIPGSELRLFGKPVAYPGRRMGVALATADTTDEARSRARQAASLIKPVKP